MKRETLARLMAEYTGDDLPGFVFDVLLMETEVRKAVDLLRRESFEAETEYKTAVKAREQRLRNVQVDCPHYETTYHGDPSGGSDSFTQCDWCGKEW